MKNLLGLFFAFGLILTACTSDSAVETADVTTDSTNVEAVVDTTNGATGGSVDTTTTVAEKPAN